MKISRNAKSQKQRKSKKKPWIYFQSKNKLLQSRRSSCDRMNYSDSHLFQRQWCKFTTNMSPTCYNRLVESTVDSNSPLYSYQWTMYLFFILLTFQLKIRQKCDTSHIQTNIFMLSFSIVFFSGVLHQLVPLIVLVTQY